MAADLKGSSWRTFMENTSAAGQRVSGMAYHRSSKSGQGEQGSSMKVGALLGAHFLSGGGQGSAGWGTEGKILASNGQIVCLFL